jgi:hypothetical protein
MRSDHPVPIPGDRHDPVLAGQRFGEQVGEIEGNGVGLDLEKRDPERLRENPCARVRVQPVRKEGGLGQRDPEGRGALPHLLQVVGSDVTELEELLEEIVRRGRHGA